MILGVADYKTWLNYTATDRDGVYTMLCSEVSEAIKNKLRQPIEMNTYVEYYDAPPNETFTLKWLPVWPTGLQVIVAPGSYGNPAAFTAPGATPLTINVDYIVDWDQPNGSSRSGLLRKTNNLWGYNYTSPAGRLGSRLDPDRLAIQVTYTAGYAPVPQDIQMAAYLAISKLYMMRQLGAQATSASLNGASYSIPATATAVLDDPTIWGLLRPYGDPVFLGSR